MGMRRPERAGDGRALARPAAEPGDILRRHDGGGDRSQPLEALRPVLPALRAEGDAFVTP
ncbi:hypothetical protein PUR71_25090 [Streptomyces sp. SP17BM10]|uniref:hypothetical protein n=1 Tax=Streptomyces sp. SP17BM10 TaxID=3002530 RepID=UPI002E78C34B|nr:hypothetical protein [Streptomyces sp. SP17BM10]MEE1786149.1 hypothetical protein [Streptomyces sp. SP17BM10]